MTQSEVPPDVSPEAAAKAARTIFLLSGTFFFIFMGAGAQQLYIAPYLTECTEWSGLMRALVPATVYISMMIFRIVAESSTIINDLRISTSSLSEPIAKPLYILMDHSGPPGPIPAATAVPQSCWTQASRHSRTLHGLQS